MTRISSLSLQLFLFDINIYIGGFVKARSKQMSATTLKTRFNKPEGMKYFVLYRRVFRREEALL
jgi:hypothetical protein